jgi:hypothetical protein
MFDQPQVHIVACKGAGEKETAVQVAAGLADNHRRYHSRASAHPAVGIAAVPVAGRFGTVTACPNELNSLVQQAIQHDRVLVEVV